MAHGLGITGPKGIQYRIQNANNCTFKVYNVHESKFVFIKPCPGVGTTEKKKKKIQMLYEFVSLIITYIVIIYK